MKDRELNYRTIGEKDIPLLKAIFSIPEYDLYFAENDSSEESWRNRMPFFQSRHSLIVSDGDGDIGWLMYHEEAPDSCFIDILVLLPAERFRGYGRRIISDLLRMHPQYSRIILDVQQRNTAAISFYRRLGFIITGQSSQPVGDSLVDYWQMSLQRRNDA
ncbi:MAG: GNAT family N-acetyltransferase [Erysipelotrichaceae bacterium]|nr:GNAT family N-acetyltransferase [Erysipelotrichaceae bacterium]